MVQQRRRQRVVPFGLDLRDPVRRPDQWQALAGSRDREADTVWRPAEGHLRMGYSSGLPRPFIGHAFLTHRADKPNAFAGDGADQALLIAIIADCSARRIDAADQARL